MIRYQCIACGAVGETFACDHCGKDTLLKLPNLEEPIAQ